MRRTYWHDWVTLALGVWLFSSPSVIGPTAVVATWNAWLFGGLVAVLSVWTLKRSSAATAEGILGVLGLWLFMSPWVLNYSGVHPEDWNAWIVGASVVILLAWKDRAVRLRTRAGLSGAFSDRSGRLPGTWEHERRMFPLGR